MTDQPPKKTKAKIERFDFPPDVDQDEIILKIAQMLGIPPDDPRLKEVKVIKKPDHPTPEPPKGE